jgi:YesN/AraC family two-component response regulator
MVPDSVKSSLSSMLYLYRNMPINKEFYNLYKKFDKEVNDPDAFSCEVVENMVKMVFYTLARTKSLTKESRRKNNMIEDVVSYVKENFNQAINLSQVAKDHFISQEHLSRTFKKHTGFGFNEYLTLVRLQHAEQLLKSDEKMSISAIAYSCGFNDSNYFSDKFKKVYGTSPLKYSKTYDTDKGE